MGLCYGPMGHHATSLDCELDHDFLCGAIARFLPKNEKCECNQVVTDSIFSSLVQTELLQKTRAIRHGSVQEQPTATNDEAGKIAGCDEGSTLKC